MCGPESFICTCLYPFARDHLLPVLKEAASMITQAPVQFEAMKRQLERAQYFIDEADRKAAAEGDNFKREETRDMVKELIEASFQMEDIMDEYFLHEQQQRSRRDPGCVRFNPEEAANVIRPVLTRLLLAQKIQSVASRVDKIKKKYGIDDSFLTQASSEPEPGQGGSSSGGNQDPKVRNLREEAPLYIKEADVVGFEVPKAQLIDWLVKGQEERTVISVVGMGGQGKTTLARKVFESKEVIAHFDCYAWITVSQTFSVKELLKDMLLQFRKEKSNSHISEMDRKTLRDEMRKYLQDMRYVVFLDDVWVTELWDEIEFDMIDNTKGSRIFITTRKREVALYFKNPSTTRVHDLQPLDETQSYKLFRNKAFHNGICPEELKDVSSKIVKRCKGLPLAIVVIGNVLSRKDPYEWIDFSKTLFSEMENNPNLNVVTKILRFSYDELTFNLKPCLLYFGMYPEDFAVKSKRLISQWIAEGFIKLQKDKTLEKVAEGYLKELVQRSLVLVSSFTIDGKPKSYRVHDMVREMILGKSEDLNFCQYIHQDDQSTLGGKSRRVSIATSSKALLQSTETSHIRSLLFFLDEKSPEHAKRIPRQCKLLKVLDFVKFPLSCNIFPESFLNSLHLKYLSFHTTTLTSLPESIVKLENLETLDVWGNGFMPLPVEIGKLTKLRHLRGSFKCFADQNYYIGGLGSLQTLHKLLIPSFKVALIDELGKLSQLRELRLACLFGEEGILLWHSINKMPYLEKLALTTKSTTLLGGLHLISPPPTLRKLLLSGPLEKFPEWISKLPKLVKLTLQYSDLTDDSLKLLSKLPNLLSLHMFNCYEGESLYFQDRDFEKLKQLTIRKIRSLTSIVIDKGALHSLKELTLYHIPYLKGVPSGIQHLENLQVLNFTFMPSQLVSRITPLGGQDHWIIKHVPSVNIY